MSDSAIKNLEPSVSTTCRSTIDTGSNSDAKIIVIGSGPVGMRFVETLLKRAPMARVQLFGNEPYQPYNRVQLSALLAGEINRDALDIPFPRRVKSLIFPTSFRLFDT